MFFHLPPLSKFWPEKEPGKCGFPQQRIRRTRWIKKGLDKLCRIRFWIQGVLASCLRGGCDAQALRRRCVDSGTHAHGQGNSHSTKEATIWRPKASPGCCLPVWMDVYTAHRFEDHCCLKKKMHQVWGNWKFFIRGKKLFFLEYCYHEKRIW